MFLVNKAEDASFPPTLAKKENGFWIDSNSLIEIVAIIGANPLLMFFVLLAFERGYGSPKFD